MLLQTQENYKIVNSDAFLLCNMNLFLGKLKNSDFDYVENISGGAKYTNITINKWIKDMPDKKKREVCESNVLRLYMLQMKLLLQA